MRSAQALIMVVIVSQTAAAAAIAGDRTNVRGPAAAPLERVANAVDGAESSHGKDLGMWRPDPSGPQGPMQVSEAAATDVGGGDRFDLIENRAIGRAYLAQLYWRYGNWPDAIAAYNWGIGKVDAWVRAGRPADKLLVGVAVYLRRVLHESGLCDGNQKPTKGHAAEPVGLPPDTVMHAACSAPEGWGSIAGKPSGFAKKLDQAMKLALMQASRGR